MKPFIPDYKFIDQYFNGKKRHKNYFKALDVAFHIQFHFDGYFQRPWLAQQSTHKPELVNPYFQRLIDQRRPSETAPILTYRRMQYLPVTKVPCNKVVNSLKKIVKSEDWKIDYNKSKVPASLPETDTLEQYCEHDFPKYDSVEHWAYTSLIRWMLIDPNAVICVMPIDWDVEENEYLQPFPHIIQSKDVWDIEEGKYIVFESPYKCEYIDDDGKTKEGKIVMTVTNESFYEARQTGEDKYEIIDHQHNLKEMPAWVIGGESKTPDLKQPFYESPIQSMLPSLDAAARDASDLDAEKVQHLFSTMWYIQSQACSACQGSGNVLAQGSQVVCPTCEGKGTSKLKPYDDVVINMDDLNSAGKNVPTPPGGYFVKPTEMVALMRNEITTEIYDALASVNMEWLGETPLNQSGKAKEIDRDELNNFVYGIAYHLVEQVINPVYWFINEIRYQMAVPNPDVRKAMLPFIDVPENYDFLTQKDAVDNLIKIAESNVSANIKDLAEMKYIHSEFQDIPAIRDKMKVIHDHDPFPAYAPADLQVLVGAGLVDKVDAILSIYITTFVDEQLAADPKFVDVDFEKRKTILYEMAQQKVDDLDTKALDAVTKIAKGSPLMDAEGNQVDAQGNIITSAADLAAQKKAPIKKPAPVAK
jgi:hypothetical protein